MFGGGKSVQRGRPGWPQQLAVLGQQDPTLGLRLLDQRVGGFPGAARIRD